MCIRIFICVSDKRMRECTLVRVAYNADGSLSDQCRIRIVAWLGIVFGYHSDAEFGVFD